MAVPETSVNGVPFSEIAVLPPRVVSHIRQVYVEGLELGRNPRAFSKLGDSSVLTDHFLTRFDAPQDSGLYDLGVYEFLRPAIDYYAGSFRRYGVGARVALSAHGAQDPQWANKEYCGPNETLLLCEIRLHNPSILLIRLGTNDAGSAERFHADMSSIIETTLAQGVIPVLATKADRFEGDDRNNGVLRELAADYRIPLWDFDRLAGTLPGRGLDIDDAHLTVHTDNDYTDPVTLSRGYPTSDLSALIVLDALRQTLDGVVAPDSDLTE